MQMTEWTYFFMFSPVNLQWGILAVPAHHVTFSLMKIQDKVHPLEITHTIKLIKVYK